ncbi:MAG: DegT/DnrJ/EryC1/StrS family aminotransferase [Nannocystis sp.]|nr:DegT/DnrJ/EryC1/StrS family aminotransferase [Nannocystis sp.]MBA3544863.1 DegT/DnrJ/EryC1/StrS family aminotransferase [Nannocystis sp.]
MKDSAKLKLVPTDPTTSPISATPRRPRSAVDQVLAIDGGPPVRKTPLPGPYPGALLIGREEERAVLEVLRSKSLFRYYGPGVLGKAAEFERRFAARIGSHHALAVNSGTSALKCALFAVGVGIGDVVLVPSFSYVATADVVLALGARPVFVEIDDSMTLDPIDLRRKLSLYDGPKPKAICVVHLFGVAADMDPILAIGAEYGIPVIEDCAQSCGAMYRGKTVGQLGAAGIFSFQLNKVITAGEGGAIVTDDPVLYDRAVRLHDHGNHRGNEGAGVPMIGEGLRVGEMTAAILLAQLGRLDDILSRMRIAKRWLVERLGDVPGLQLTRTPDPEGDGGVSLTFFTESVEKTTRVVEALNAEGIRVLRQYGGKLLFMQPAVRSVNLQPEPLCPVSTDLVGRCVFLGLTTTFTKRDLQDIVTGIRKVMRKV